MFLFKIIGFVITKEVAKSTILKSSGTFKLFQITTTWHNTSVQKLSIVNNDYTTILSKCLNYFLF